MESTNLILKYKNGCQESFCRFYTLHTDNLYRYVLGLSGNTAVADDVVCATWEKFILSVPDIKSNPKAYLYTIARNAWLDEVKREVRHTSIHELDIVNDPHHEEGVDILQLNYLLNKLQALPTDQRDALLLKHFAGFSIEDIATLQRCSTEGAKTRVRYAVNKLKRLVASRAF